ncbi:hypothetical protein LHFGNBLO_006355 (plasmid) [Mesorhizobium sp. AR10]|uniref:hypothetical protein n=1 Tax=Mesorhizobium sp. AR10 TaxID=2865839 RepID=UPI00215FC59E|nr:hypothetical protein [Mesorhizobium sp. AR10]UVK35557.1 hypothetical protein LHFGNBLO_006355 [Mesorhizobium sp. AR10]
MAQRHRKPKNAAIAGASDGLAVNRLAGIDLARGLAVFGMYAVHVGPGGGEGLVGGVMQFAYGRSSVLFAVLTGFFAHPHYRPQRAAIGGSR